MDTYSIVRKHEKEPTSTSANMREYISLVQQLIQLAKKKQERSDKQPSAEQEYGKTGGKDTAMQTDFIKH